MTKGDNQKLKLLYLAKILMRETDDQHSLTLAQITERLNDCGVNADRKTLYTDFEELRHYGLDIIKVQAQRNFYYHIGNREFELPELKLLVDSVQSAKFEQADSETGIPHQQIRSPETAAAGFHYRPGQDCERKHLL